MEIGVGLSNSEENRVAWVVENEGVGGNFRPSEVSGEREEMG